MNFSRVASSGNSLPPAIYWEYVLPRYRKKNQGICSYSFYSSTCKNTASLNVLLWKLLSFLPKSFSFLLLLNLPITFPVKPQLLEGVEREKNTFLFILGCIRQVEFFPTQRLVWWEPPGMRISTNFRAWDNFASEKKNKTIQKALQTAGLTIQFILQISCCISLLWNPQAFAVLAKTQEKAM